MRIKTFEAFEMAEALRAVRDAMGPDAVILATREIPKHQGSGGLLGRPIVQVTAAIDRADPEEAEPRITPFNLCRLQDAYAELRSSFSALLEQTSRRVLSDALSGTGPALSNLFERLAANGVEGRDSLELLTAMRRRLSAHDWQREEVVRECAKEALADMVRTAGPVARPGDAPAVAVFVGPTGVGKTTTVAKLAAQRVQRKEPVMLVTLDTRRVGALEQIQSYARAIGVTVYPAVSAGQLGDLLSRRKEGGLVLVDTPGRNHLDAAQIGELGELGRLGLPVQTHLVLASHIRPSDLDAMIDRFSAVPVDRLLFTKMDETRAYGGIFSAMKNGNKPISYLTNGPRVPDDIEVATPQRLAELVMN